MSTNNDKPPTTGRVEVVADRSDDGTFELRVERPSDSVTVVAGKPHSERVASGAVSTTKLSASSSESIPKSRKLALAAGGLAAAGIAGVFIATIGGGTGPSSEPPLVEPEPAETFQAFTIQTPAANLPRAVLATDVGADTVEEQPEEFAQQSPVSPPPPEPVLEPEAIPSPNPAAIRMDPSVARQLQNVRVSAEPVLVLAVDGNDDGDDEYDEYDEYEDDDEYDEYDDDDDDDEYDDSDFE
jgi:hypothetical protein